MSTEIDRNTPWHKVSSGTHGHKENFVINAVEMQVRSLTKSESADVNSRSGCVKGIRNLVKIQI